MDATLINLLAAVASAVAAVASVFVAVVLGRRADALATAQRRHSAFSTAAEWRRDLTGWAAEAIDVLSEATYCCEDKAEGAATERLFICRFRVSALIDRGRFFLPNIRRDEHGTDKPAAYRGYRHSALDPLVAAERVLSTGQTGSFTDRRYALIAMKREFVSAIQQILDPEHFNREVAKMISEGHESQRPDPTLGGLLPDNQNIPRGAEALLADPHSRHLGVRRSG
jgi:hypothetical protein